MPWGSNLSDISIVLFHCLKCSYYIYAFWLYSWELLFSACPPGLIIASLLFLGALYLRVPPPDPSIIQDIVGIDPITITDETKITLDDGYFMKTCAHRFAGLDAPENSIAAIKKSKEKGCTAVEFDVAMTKDGVAIVFHDSDVNRLCNATGTVCDMTWDELNKLDISVKHPLSERFTGERIARFDDAVQMCLDSGYRMFIDLKGDSFKIIPVILDMFKRHEQLYTKAIVSSFNPILIYMIRRANNRIAGSLAWRPFCFSYGHFSGHGGPDRKNYSNPFVHYPVRAMEMVYNCLLNSLVYYVLGLSTILLHKDCLTAEVARKWRKRGVRPIAFTVNLPVEKQYFRRILKVTYMTDTLDSEGC